MMRGVNQWGVNCVSLYFHLNISIFPNALLKYKTFTQEHIQDRQCKTMDDVLRVYNLADVEPFAEALKKTAEQYYPDKIDMLKDAVTIPGISMTYVLNKALDNDKNLELYAPGGACNMCKEKKSNWTVVSVMER